VFEDEETMELGEPAGIDVDGNASTEFSVCSNSIGSSTRRRDPR
jgi:hypothetical protein